MRERGGRTLPLVEISEDQAVPYIRQVVEHGTTVYADELRPGMPCMPSMPGGSTTASRSTTKARTPTKPSRSSRACAGLRSASTIASGRHLHAYAGEMAWREENRRKPNGTQFMN